MLHEGMAGGTLTVNTLLTGNGPEESDKFDFVMRF